MKNCGSRVLALAVSLALGGGVFAQSASNQRLSAWILKQDPDALGYLPGLSWRVPSEVPIQLSLKLELLSELSAANSGLAALVSALPVTGRVPLKVVDPHWLSIHPERDPVLREGHSVVLPGRPETVTVIKVDGRLCRVSHVASQEAATYLSACGLRGMADWAWVVQPDGVVDRVGVSPWNSNAQDALAPGAWVWAPPASSFPLAFSEKLVRFLATQGPAPDFFAPEKLPPNENSRAGVGLAAGVASTITPGRRPEKEPEPIRRLEPLAVRSRDLDITSSNFGTSGLLQAPSARMRPEGTLLFSRTRVDPYTHMNIVMQPLKGIEFGLRYTAIGDRLYGPEFFSGSQTYKDKGFDLKAGIWEESRFIPAVAVGLRDLAGTGLFSSEYVVASKRLWDFDMTAGVGWGQMAGARRAGGAGVATGGTFAVTNYFSGPAKPFAGLQWSSGQYVFKAELDPNDYRNEPNGSGSLARRSRYNFGLTYRPYRWLDLTAGWERGNTLGLTFTFHTDVSQLQIPKFGDLPAVPVSPIAPVSAPDWKKTAGDVKAQTGWSVGSVRAAGANLSVELDEPGGTYRQYRVDRAVAVLHRDAPQDIKQFTLRNNAFDIPMSEYVVDRTRWVESRLEPKTPRGDVPASVVRENTAPEGKVLFKNEEEPFLTGFRIGYGQHLGSPAGFILYQVYASQSIAMRLGSRSTWLTGSVRYRLIDNFDKFKYDGFSGLPPVRTYLRRYMIDSRLTIPELMITHARKVSNNQYVSLYGGYLEEMFAGAGAEWLYRPFASRFAFGVDVNLVKQREFVQRFGFLDPAYQVATGHATAYWDTGWNGVELRASVGRYLAKDLGATVEAVKTFKTGVTVGAFATKTNVSAEQFGEGSFDKGIFLSIPFDAMFTKSTPGSYSTLYRPLTRDGGAKLVRPMQLYGLTGLRDRRLFDFEPAPAPRGQILSADDKKDQRVVMPGRDLPFTSMSPSAIEDWNPGGQALGKLEAELFRQGFTLSRAAVDQSYRINVVVGHNDIDPVLAVGRVLRSVLAVAPVDAREIRVGFQASGAVPLVEYDFMNLDTARGFLAGELSLDVFRKTVVVRYVDPTAKVTDPLKGLSEVKPLTRKSIKEVVLSANPLKRVSQDVIDAASHSPKLDWGSFGALAVSSVISSSILDKKLNTFVGKHSNSAGLKVINRIGDGLPLLGLAGAGLMALDGSDPRRSATGYASVEAGMTATLVATGLKYAFGRARPNLGLGSSDYKPGSSASDRDSFPSRHTAMSWALVTPFALEYNAPWLYGVAAVTNLSRVGKREHWFSDTVGGGLLGYGIGRLFWESSRNNRSLPQVLVAPDSVNFSWKFK